MNRWVFGELKLVFEQLLCHVLAFVLSKGGLLKGLFMINVGIIINLPFWNGL